MCVCVCERCGACKIPDVNAGVEELEMLPGSTSANFDIFRIKTEDLTNQQSEIKEAWSYLRRENEAGRVVVIFSARK